MAKYNYSYKTDQENIGRAVLRDVPVSAKHAIEVCSHIRNKTVEKAKSYLESVKKLEQPVHMRRFTEGAGHKSGLGSGKFPVKAADNILKAVKSAESNAIDKGLSTNLKIVHISTQRASTPWRYGRQRRRKMKRIHIEVVLSEIEKKKEAPKTETKKAEETQSSKAASAPKPKVLSESAAKPVQKEVAKTENKKETKSESKPKPEEKKETKDKK